MPYLWDFIRGIRNATLYHRFIYLYIMRNSAMFKSKIAGAGLPEYCCCCCR